MLRYFQRASYRRMVGTIIPGDEANVRASAKTSYRPCGVIGCVRIGPWRRPFRTDNV
jgi:hypothetical protein